MRPRLLFATLLPLVGLLVACGGGSGGSGGTGGGDHSGTFVVSGSTTVLSRNMSTDAGWVERMRYTIGNGLPVAHPQANELYMARFTTANEPFYFDIHDLNTFEMTRGRALEWPDSNDLSRMHGIAVSPSGRYVAAMVTFGDTRRLQVIDTTTDPPTRILDGFRGVTGADLLWLSDDQLVFTMDLSALPDVPATGGIVMINPHEADPETGVDIDVLVDYAANEWSGNDSASNFALSPDGTQVAYSYAGNIWVFEPGSDSREPHQLTAGPNDHHGPTFSPDGASIAFIERHPEWQSYLFVVPNHRAAPIEVNGDLANQSHRVAGVAAARVLSWR